MAARCEKCGYHLEPAEEHLGHRGCLVCQRDAANERAEGLAKELADTERCHDSALRRAEEVNARAGDISRKLREMTRQRDEAEQRAEEAEREIGEHAAKCADIVTAAEKRAEIFNTRAIRDRARANRLAATLRETKETLRNPGLTERAKLEKAHAVLGALTDTPEPEGG